MNSVPEKTEFAFNELSDVAKQKARETYCSSDYPYNEWWDGVYEDANRMAKKLGLDITTTKQSKQTGRAYREISIYFSGFYSQSDGASFEGSYCYNPRAIDEIKAERNDETLITLAEQLAFLQITRRLLGYEPFSATITISRHYSHSNTMNVEVNSEDEEDDHSQVSEELEETITQLFKEFADWIYSSLKNEYDYLYSDECVDEHLDEEIFDIDGQVI